MTPAEHRAHNRLNAWASRGPDPWRTEAAYYAQAAELDALELRTDLTPIEAARRDYLRVERRCGAIGLPGERWTPEALAADVARVEREFMQPAALAAE